MKILIATETYLPNISGVVVFTQNLAEELIKRGHTVAVFAPSTHRVRSYEVKKGIHIYRFPSLPVPLRSKTRFTVRQYRRVEEAFKEFSPDVVHLQSPTGVPAAVRRCANKQFVPVIATQHFLLEFIMAYLKPFPFIGTLTHRALVSYLNRFYRHCEYITCPTESIKKNLIKTQIKVPLHVISNGISLKKFTPHVHAQSEKPIVLYVGRVDQDKNLQVILDSIPAVTAETNAQYYIVGGGNRLLSIKRWVRLHGLENKVTFTGKIGHDSAQLRKLYSDAAVVLAPCLIETQSITTLEALASGIPVVASDAGALPELVRHGENGYLVPPSEPEKFSEYIIKLVQDPILRQRMGAAGRLVAEKHDFQKVVDKLVTIYEGHRD